MVSELAADLLPDQTDDRRRLQAYTNRYGDGCHRGFVATRFEWPRSAGLHTPAPPNNQARNRNTVAFASIPSISDVPQLAGSPTEAAPNYRTFDPNGRVH